MLSHARFEALPPGRLSLPFQWKSLIYTHSYIYLYAPLSRYAVSNPSTSAMSSNFNIADNSARDEIAGRSNRLKHVCDLGTEPEANFSIVNGRNSPSLPCKYLKPPLGTLDVPVTNCNSLHLSTSLKSSLKMDQKFNMTECVAESVYVFLICGEREERERV
jgi:hypothetical protein